MDNRLDFVNYTTKHLETLTEDDTLFVISHNREEGDLFFSLFGDWEDISLIMSNKDVINHSGESKQDFQEIKVLMLNTAINICDQDTKMLNVLLKELKKLKKNKKKKQGI